MFLEKIKALLQVGGNDVANGNPVPVSDAGGALTIDGSVSATLAAETTKVIGTVNIAASQTVGLATGSNAVGKLAENSGIDVGDVTVNNLNTTPVITRSAVGSPSDSLARPNDTTAYVANDAMSTAGGENLEFATGLENGAKLLIYSAQILGTDSAVPSGMTTFRLHLFNAAPTAIADNAAWALASADAAKYLGYITLSAPEDMGDVIFKRTDGINAAIACAAASATIYGQLQTLGAFTPVAEKIYTIQLCLGVI